MDPDEAAAHAAAMEAGTWQPDQLPHWAPMSLESRPSAKVIADKLDRGEPLTPAEQRRYDEIVASVDDEDAVEQQDQFRVIECELVERKLSIAPCRTARPRKVNFWSGSIW